MVQYNTILPYLVPYHLCLCTCCNDSMEACQKIIYYIPFFIISGKSNLHLSYGTHVSLPDDQILTYLLHQKVQESHLLIFSVYYHLDANCIHFSAQALEILQCLKLMVDCILFQKAMKLILSSGVSPLDARTTSAIKGGQKLT